MERLSNNEAVIQQIIKNIDEDMTQEEIVKLVVEHIDYQSEEAQKMSFGQKMADLLTSFVGSWKFVISFSLFIIVWILLNTFLAVKAFDPFPYILLNLFLSCVAAIQAPLVMMSQNRQEEKDRERAKSDYQVNLKTEIIIRDIHSTLQTVKGEQRITRQILKDLEQHIWDEKSLEEHTLPD